MLRFELEKELLAGKADFKTLPDLWNSKMQEYLGVTPDSDANGVLQDVHWSAGILGYFPTYALGNIISGQLWKKVRSEMPDLDDKLRSGDFKPLLAWLRTNVHEHACKFLPGELISKITGGPIDSAPYISYLKEKFLAIYGA
jgi:carboxypeptidase Taq